MIAAFLDEDRALRLSAHPRLLTEIRERNPGVSDLRTVETASYQPYRETYDDGRW
jgi:hypothetical protein